MAGKPLRYRVRFKLEDDGQEYEVTPNWAYIDHVEQAITSQYDVQVNLESGRYRWREIANVIYSALVTGGYNVEYGEVFESCRQMGLGECAIIAGKIIMAASNVDPETISEVPETISEGEQVGTGEAGEDAQGKALDSERDG